MKWQTIFYKDIYIYTNIILPAGNVSQVITEQSEDELQAPATKLINYVRNVCLQFPDVPMDKHPI